MFLRAAAVFGHQTPASRKMMEKIASSTMTQKIDSTTDLVVELADALGAAAAPAGPRSSRSMAMTAPNTGALIMPV